VGLQENIELGGQNMSSYIEVRNVSKSFSGRAILQNISLSVEQGTTVGLVGANGSGKSVLFKIICGFEKPDQGSVYVRGRQIGKNGRDFPADMGVFINSPGFIGIYSGFQNLKFLADIQGKIGEKEIRQTMTKVGLDPDNKAKVDNYSLGMKQKLGLAQAIMEGQDILILDEPFNALDYKTYEDVKTIIRMLKAEGKTIFLTSHHYKDIEQLCDQVYLIEDCQLLPITEEIAARYREME
jgi:ABC transporter